MAPASSKNHPPWATTEQTSALRAHVVLQRHKMVVPPRILPDDVERAIQILDQHDPSTAKADAKDLKPIDYAKYAINDHLRPMALAAGMHNLHQEGIKKGNLVDLLTDWDLQNVPLIAALLPRSDKATKSVIPKQVVSTRKTAETGPTESKKRKAVPTKVTAVKKPRSNANAPLEDYDIETKGRNELDDGDSLPQTAVEGSTPARKLAQPRTRFRKPRNLQPLATETDLEVNKDMAALALRKFGEHKGGSTDEALVHNREEDDKRLETEAGEVQVPAPGRHRTKRQASRSGKGKKKNSKAGTTKEMLNKDGTLKTAKQLEEEQRLKDEEEEKKLHEARSLGHYSDPIVAKQFRVVHKTVRAPLDGHIRPGVKPAPTDQLGSWRLHERLMNQAKEEGKDLDLWMGGGASPSRHGSEEDIYEEW
ncbi:uncharacterized protein J4E92_009082 [Alternaria infectoria]|uniref:uncharacterized protein n=1 Tax=Alternaria infectoria TaxID=45303 RepID=UPI00221FD53E|nr:uncharacterized protein J4E92_009082 [Alternaria infectoria]KAI4916578.1 hypothetical protein J4E92_009082 [Alternaria infectoria]